MGSQFCPYIWSVLLGGFICLSRYVTHCTIVCDISSFRYLLVWDKNMIWVNVFSHFGELPQLVTNYVCPSFCLGSCAEVFVPQFFTCDGTRDMVFLG